MDRFALVFPGQGSQYVGMGSSLAELSPVAADVFRTADDALGESISQLCFSGPADGLDQTVNAQPAILATSIAYLRALREASGETEAPVFFAGHSMGQYSAMVAAGVLNLGDAIRLVRERGRQMQQSAADGAMAAVIGLPDERVAELVSFAQASGTFTIANRNSPGQIVVSGDRRAVERAAEVARELGAKRALLLPVSVAAHSPLMSRAADGMRGIVATVTFNDPAAPLLANADGRPLTTAAECRAELVEHLTRGVDWVTAVERMRAAGVTRFVEVGPGRVLTGLIKRIVPEADAVALDDPAAAGRLAVPRLIQAASPA
ncbi:MAG: ACP S-malonyltransferase [Chloroflexota bacterium]|nr:ACP S-malonyltransferase [Chloroflexota bacterium]